MLFRKNASPELFSLHIPKTAGTSFRNILKIVYGDKQVLRFDINEKSEVRVNESLYTSRKLPDAKVLHGHFPIESLLELFEMPQKYNLITWVRNPVSRVISNYFYLESRLREILNEEVNNYNILSKMQKSLIEFSRAEVNRNRQYKFMRGLPIERFDFIGIQEEFETEIRRLSKIMNWPDVPAVLYHNKTTLKSEVIGDDVLREIEELNKLDAAIYKQAVEIRNSFNDSGIK